MGHANKASGSLVYSFLMAIPYSYAIQVYATTRPTLSAFSQHLIIQAGLPPRHADLP